MKNKIVLAVAAIGLGFSINASAGWSSQCSTASQKANYYCNAVMDDAQCRYWVAVVRGCGLPSEV
ncbi:MAG: hypothetical protein HRT35_22400 [Algicola sp.]|nr:hypothetical protein [Algicola sp.]